MFDKELENNYILNTRMLKGKDIIEKWFPTKYEKINNLLGDYNLAVLGSISDDVVSKTGLDTLEQLVELINHYSSKKILRKVDNTKLKNQALVLLKKWNPDNYHDLLSQLTDSDLIKLADVDDNVISCYGLNTIIDIKTCIKMNETKNISNISVDFYNGNYNEFLYNTFLSYRRIKKNTIDTDIELNNFDFEFFDFLMNNMIETYLTYHNK